jgi:hypothetical protein
MYALNIIILCIYTILIYTYSRPKLLVIRTDVDTLRYRQLAIRWQNNKKSKSERQKSEKGWKALVLERRICRTKAFPENALISRLKCVEGTFCAGITQPL